MTDAAQTQSECERLAGEIETLVQSGIGGLKAGARREAEASASEVSDLLFRNIPTIVAALRFSGRRGQVGAYNPRITDAGLRQALAEAREQEGQRDMASDA